MRILSILSTAIAVVYAGRRNSDGQPSLATPQLVEEAFQELHEQVESLPDQEQFYRNSDLTDDFIKNDAGTGSTNLLSQSQRRSKVGSSTSQTELSHYRRSTSQTVLSIGATKEEKEQTLQTKLSHKFLDIEGKIDELYSQLNGVQMNFTRASFLGEEYDSRISKANGASNIVTVNQFTNQRRLGLLTKRLADVKGEALNAKSKFGDSLNTTKVMKKEVERLHKVIDQELSDENKQKLEKHEAVIRALSGTDKDVSVEHMEGKIKSVLGKTDELNAKLTAAVKTTLAKEIKPPLNTARAAARRIGRIEPRRWSGMLTDEY